MTEYTPTTEEVREDFAFPWSPEQIGDRPARVAAFDRWLAAHDAEVRAGVVAEEPEWEGFYVIPNTDNTDQDSLWDGTIHPTWEAAQASLDEARADWGQDAENYHVVALVPVKQGDDT